MGSLTTGIITTPGAGNGAACPAGAVPGRVAVAPCTGAGCCGYCAGYVVGEPPLEQAIESSAATHGREYRTKESERIDIEPEHSNRGSSPCGNLRGVLPRPGH